MGQRGQWSRCRRVLSPPDAGSSEVSSQPTEVPPGFLSPPSPGCVPPEDPEAAGPAQSPVPKPKPNVAEPKPLPVLPPKPKHKQDAPLLPVGRLAPQFTPKAKQLQALLPKLVVPVPVGPKVQPKVCPAKYPEVARSYAAKYGDKSRRLQ